MQNDSNKGQSNFIDVQNTKQKDESIRPKEPGDSKRKRKIPLLIVFLIDIVIAACALLIFTLYYVVLEDDLSQNMVQLPGTVTVQPSPQASAEPEESSATADPTDEAASETPAVDENSWRVKFADKFTDGEVVKTDNAYKSANISITIDTVSKDDVTYYVADIYVADMKYFKTAFANEEFKAGIGSTAEIGDKHNAILAINGDFCSKNKGVVVRNGVLYRDKEYKSDLLVMYNDGSMQTFSPSDFDLEAIKQNGAYQVWTFGPTLLENGQPMEEFNSSVQTRNPRTAIGYYEPGHYCFVVVDGRQPGYSKGYEMKELSQLMSSLGCSVAYNLDGGKSSEMVFDGTLYSHPFEGGRETCDIILIADE